MAALPTFSMPRPTLACALRHPACLGLGLALALLGSAPARAQLAPPAEDPAPARLRITPFAGWAPEVRRQELWGIPQPDGSPAIVAETTLAEGIVAGATLEYGFTPRWSLLLGGMFMNRDVSTYLLPDSARLTFTGSTSILLKAGASFQLPQPADGLNIYRLHASLFAAPFYMIEMPDEVAGVGDTDLFDTQGHFGLNFGATGELPFDGDRFALQLAVEDYLTLWNDDQLARWPRFAFGGNPTADADPSHQWVIRAGLRIRLR